MGSEQRQQAREVIMGKVRRVHIQPSRTRGRQESHPWPRILLAPAGPCVRVCVREQMCG